MATKMKVPDEENDVLAGEAVAKYRAQQAKSAAPKPKSVAPKPRPKMSEAEESARNDMLAGEMVYPTVKKKNGGMIKSSASSRADGCAQRGKTRGRFV